MRQRRRVKPEATAPDGEATTKERESRGREAGVWISWSLFAAALVRGIWSGGLRVRVRVEVLGVWHWVFWVPTPITAQASLELFSEERALKHVRVLSDDIGFRQVSTTGIRKAATYLERECREMATLARKRPDLDAQVDVEMVSGAIVDRIFGNPLINVYRNLTNVVLFVGPKEALDKPAVLINAHYDSALGSPGAADCGSCVGVGMEVLRALIQSDFSFPCPIILLLNGGEETLLQAAHGFMQQSAWRDRVGTFINLESTGSGGGPILFQYTGTWTLRAYSTGTPFPRAIVLGQEFFEAGVIPADTDFRMFSRDHHGAYPGVDLATVLDAASYHTDRDTVSRLKPGSTQEYGTTVLAVTQKMMEMLETHGKDTSSEKLVYSDACHVFMVLYSIQTAKWLHFTPIAFFLISLVIVSNKGRFVRVAVMGILQNLLSLALAICMPAIFGVLRRPMIWFSHHVVAFCFYWPASLLGFLLPMHHGQLPVDVSGKFAGISLLFGVLAWGLAYASIGSSILPFTIALSTGIASLMTSLSKTLPFPSLLVASFFSCISCSSLLIVLIKHVMEKIGMAGGGRQAFGFLVPDAVVGVLNGFLVVCALQPLSPLLTVHWNRQSKGKVMKSLLLGCVAVGVVSSFFSPYSVQRPKRIFLNHLCRQHKDGGCEFVWSVGSWDVVQIDESLPEALKQLPSIAPGPSDWASMAPFDRVVKDWAFPAPAFRDSGPWGTAHPRLEMVQETIDVESGRRKLELELRWEKPGWGAMNITGPIKNWSIADPLGIQEHENTVRFSQDVVEPIWPFWIEVEGDGVLQIQLGIYYPSPSDQTVTLAKQFPEWTTVVAGTSFVSQSSFPPP